MTMVELEPQPRIDTIVRLPAGGDARRTEYVGTAWFDGKPIISGLTLQRSPNAPRGFRRTSFETAFFVPDSLPYDRGQLGGAVLSASVTLRASGGDSSAIVDAAATFVDDPSGTPTWIQLAVQANIGWPAGIGYRIVALTPLDAVR
ncbi:hypothetical protein [Mycolicibacterium gadium]|jgi:hypothetical protein|uniref:Uncharacterized protein n=2 Tax=Mycolicibacterium gadium TaxID=1794 RepID=A0A7I7WJP8_MYCGU|nr:hypothetical protein [Mycolicibacterium gadium]BBZ17047.1 hypothetical protein MGAD_13820 [Mycolicibacterium gadium]